MYALKFHESAEKEWIEPRILSAELSSDLKGLYRIKLKKSGHRLVYEVFDDPLVVLVIAVGSCGKQDVYRTAANRID